MNRIRQLSLYLALATASLPLAQAGVYPAAGLQTFTFVDNTTNLVDGTTLGSGLLGTFARVITNSLQLSNKSFTGNTSSWRIPSLDPANAIQSLNANFTLRMVKGSAAAIPGSGLALCYGAIPASGDGSGDLGFSMSGGLVISIDTNQTTPNDFPSIEVFANNVSVGNFLSTGLTGSLPIIAGGSYTLTNPVTGGVTGNISYTASATSVQTAMRGVSGWAGILVAGAAGNFTVTMPAVGSYADPVGNGAALTGITMTPGQGRVVVTNTQDGGPSTPEIWTVNLRGSGFVYDANFRPVTIHWDYDGLDLSFNGQTIFTDLPTPGFNPTIGNAFAFTCDCRNGLQDTYIDDVGLSTTPALPPNTGGPIISEFMAENKDTMEDEDMDSPDWIEIYNGQAGSANLAGYVLTNGTANWTFPAVTLPGYGNLIVYASGKNRTTNTALLHTNFTLEKTGGTLTLKSPTNVTVSSYTFGNQTEDVSYGLKYQGNTIGFLSPVSPGIGTQYSYIVAPNGPSEDLLWSREGGLISSPTSITITPPVAVGAVIRYTADNTEPSSASPIWPGSYMATTTVTLRAKIFRPGYLPGAVSSRTFLQLDSSLTNYNGSGQPFQSHLPLIVFDSFGVNVDSVTDSAQPRPHRFTYSVVIDKNATSGFADITSPMVDFQGRSGTHVRGDSSGGFAQKSYAWETWDNLGNDKSVGILGMPAESDWALHGPYTDKTFVRNFICYAKMRELHEGKTGRGMRVQMVEVIYNQDPGQPISYNDYRGVYILMERIKRGKDRVDIPKLTSLVTDPNLITGGYIFRRDRLSADGNTPLPVGMHSHTPNVLNAAQTTYLTNYINAFNNALNGPNFADPVLGYAPYIDVESFIDNWWFVEVMKQIDGYRLSTYFTKDRGGKIVAAPLWDYNLSLGNADYATGDQFAGWYYPQAGDTYWWARLRQDPNYELKNWDRYWQMRKGIFNTSSIISYIENLKLQATNGSTTPVSNNMSLTLGQPATLENAAMRHYRKHPVLGTYLWPNAGGNAVVPTLDPRPWQINTTYQLEVDWMKTWLTQRLNWIDDQFFTENVIYRPVVTSHPGGNVALGAQVSLSRYAGTAPGGFSYPTGGTIYYTLDGSDPRAPAPPTPEFPFISGTANALQWLVPNANNGGLTLTAGAGATQWTNYTAPANAASWTNATSGIGYDLNPDYLPLIGAGGNLQAEMYNLNATCYVRVAFNIPDQATINGIGSLKLGLKYEDGYRAYINGVVVSGNADTDPSMTTSPATATTPVARDEAAAVNFETTDITATGLSALRVGTNVLAIHLLNAGVASSDILLVPKLTWTAPVTTPIGALAYTGPITLNSSTTVKARLFANNVWSPLTSVGYFVNTVPANASNTVISELHYNPPSPTPAETLAGYNASNDFEYIELLNVSSSNVDLTNCAFTEGVTFTFTGTDAVSLSLAPGQRVLVVANRDAFLARYGNTGVKIAGVFAGNLKNSGEAVTLLAANGSDIARFSYGTAEPWPVDADGPGYSLVLNNPAVNPTYGSGMAWRSSATIGGSPGMANSIAFIGTPTADTDSDGYSDILEYALGSNSASGSSRPQITYSTVVDPDGADPGTYLVIEFPRNLAADKVNFLPQHSTNLSTWVNSEMVYMSTSNQTNGIATVSYRASTPNESSTRSFIHLQVTPVP